MRGYNIDDYINKKFNKLTLIKNLNKIDHNYSKLALFRCDCGNEKELIFTQVLHGEVQSCGCNVRTFSNLKESETRKGKLIAILNNKKKRNTSTGYYGISLVNNKYRVRITINKKNIHIGYFTKLEDAIKARKQAEDKYFKPIIDKHK